MEYKDYYKILGVDRNADSAKIKSAYRKLARQFHPDVNKSPDAANKFKDINEAYEVLSDKDKKSRYDSLGANWQAGANFTPPPGFEGFNFNQGGFSQGFGADNGGFSDFFSSIFGDILNAQSSKGNRRTVNSSFDDLFSSGFSKGASRASRTSQQQKTENIDITQDLNVTASDLLSNKPVCVKTKTLEKCTKCSGVGSVCYECGGTGFVTKTKSLNVKIPRGIKEGQKIRLAGEGKASEYGKKGDLYFVIKFKDSEYEISDNNLTKSLEITPPEAVFGCQKEIKTLHGNIKIKIPENSRSGQMLRLKKLGLPDKTGELGYLNVKIMINIPSNISEKEKSLYKQLLELQN